MSLRDVIREVHGETDLIAILSASIRNRYHQKSPRDDGWHPSQFVGMCVRQKVIERLLGPQKVTSAVDVKLERIFDVGTALHSWYQNEYLGPSGVLWGKWECSVCEEVHWGFKPPICSCSPSAFYVFKEVPFYARLEGVDEPVVGHSDGIVFIGNKAYILEIKTINFRGFSMLVEPYLSHIMQAQVYAELACQGKIRDLPSNVDLPKISGIVFLYVSKNDSLEKEFRVELDEAVARKELKKIQLVSECLTSKSLPERHLECTSVLKLPAKKCSVCSYCFGQMSFEQIALLKGDY